MLLGTVYPRSGQVRVTNSFAIPFEEDDRDASVWFLDHDYVAAMNDMFKKINAKEKPVGWYHSGPRLRSNDLAINEVFKQRFCSDPVLCVINVRSTAAGIPVDSYHAMEEIKDDGTTTTKTFLHLVSSVEAEEAEEIGVEHLLRDVRDAAVGSLSQKVTTQLQSLQGLQSRLRAIHNYLNDIVAGKQPINHTVLNYLQDIFNLLPNISVAPGSSNGTTAADGLSQAFRVKNNDQMMTLYVSSLVRAIVAFHDLVENKLQSQQDETQLVNGDTPAENAVAAS